MIRCHKLTAREELAHLLDLHGGNRTAVLGEIRENFNVLQGRAQLLISLVTICLTIAGFSGPNIAASGPVAKAGATTGLSLVIASAIVALFGPLQLRWATQWKSDSTDETLVQLLEMRNLRTILYHVALALLCLGMCGYVASTVLYMLSR